MEENVSPEGVNKGEWGRILDDWERRNEELLQMGSDKPTESEARLSEAERAATIQNRQIGFVVEVTQGILDSQGSGYKDFSPSGLVISRAQELLSEDFIQKEIGTIDTDEVVGVLEQAKAQSFRRRLRAESGALEERGDVEGAVQLAAMALVLPNMDKSERTKVVSEMLGGELFE